MSKSIIFAHFLFFGEQYEWIAHFTQIKWALWVNRSFCSPKMSDHERFAHQVTQRKWAMWANRSFRSQKINEWVNHSFFWAKRSLTHFWTIRKSNERIPSPGYESLTGDVPAGSGRNYHTHSLFRSLCQLRESVFSLQVSLKIPEKYDNVLYY